MGLGASDAPEAAIAEVPGPCPACNLCDEQHRPEMPDGYVSFMDKQPWGN